MLKNKRILNLTVALALVASFVLPSFASAAQLKPASVRLGRLGLSASTGNDVYVTFKLPTAPTTAAKFKLTFPTGFTLTAGTPTPVTTNAPATPAATAFPGTLTSTVTSAGAGAGGTIVVSTTGAAGLNSTTLYQFTIPSGSVTNPSTTGQYIIAAESEVSAGTALDTTVVPTYITTTATGDQVNVTASVAPSFSFSLSANADTIPAADPTTIQTSGGINMLVSTNSPLGYTAYVKSSGSLVSPSTSTPIPTGAFDASPDTIAPGTAKYGLVPATGTACTTCTGALTYDAEYAVGDGTHAGSFNTTNFASFVSRSGYTNQDTISLKERIAVSTTTGYASDYADTLTIVAAGNY